MEAHESGKVVVVVVVRYVKWNLPYLAETFIFFYFTCLTSARETRCSISYLPVRLSTTEERHLGDLISDLLVSANNRWRLPFLACSLAFAGKLKASSLNSITNHYFSFSDICLIFRKPFHARKDLRRQQFPCSLYCWVRYLISPKCWLVWIYSWLNFLYVISWCIAIFFISKKER